MDRKRPLGSATAKHTALKTRPQTWSFSCLKLDFQSLHIRALPEPAFHELSILYNRPMPSINKKSSQQTYRAGSRLQHASRPHQSNPEVRLPTHVPSRAWDHEPLWQTLPILEESLALLSSAAWRGHMRVKPPLQGCYWRPCLLSS